MLLFRSQSLDMTTWEICYECEGERFVELIDDEDYGSALTSIQLAEIKAGLRGETDDVIHLLWWRPFGAEVAPLRMIRD